MGSGDRALVLDAVFLRRQLDPVCRAHVPPDGLSCFPHRPDRRPVRCGQGGASPHSRRARDFLDLRLLGFRGGLRIVARDRSCHGPHRDSGDGEVGLLAEFRDRIDRGRRHDRRAHPAIHPDDRLRRFRRDIRDQGVRRWRHDRAADRPRLLHRRPADLLAPAGHRATAPARCRQDRPAQGHPRYLACPAAHARGLRRPVLGRFHGDRGGRRRGSRRDTDLARHAAPDMGHLQDFDDRDADDLVIAVHHRRRCIHVHPVPRPDRADGFHFRRGQRRPASAMSN